MLGQATAAQARLGDAQARSIFQLATGTQATRRRGNVTATTTFLPGADKGGLGLAPSQRGGQGVGRRPARAPGGTCTMNWPGWTTGPVATGCICIACPVGTQSRR